MHITANDITLEVEEHGPRNGVPLVLIRGLGSQLIHWPDALLQGFAKRGFRVVVFDNRDVGLSARCPAPGVDGQADTILATLARGEVPQAAYGLDDMAHDVVGLMDALEIGRAHVLGISMGGGIAQVLAMDHAERLQSASIVMTRAAFTGQGGIDQLLSRDQDRAGYIETALAGDHAWGSPGFPASDSYFRELAGRAYDRGADAAGVNRQLLAILSSPDRREDLRAVDLPCHVIHGADDALIPPEAGTEIAALIPGAELEIIPGMGHIITPALAPLLVGKVTDFIERRGR
ncbi:alpha/beta hydrolase [Lutimaribacter sp. EGI FJ00015]|uniref:Alpha/beta hydrolase n=1 Tax=Lutimaribacter degradans TaxID=2945989 RepID=A0ACC5ZUX2_9RHOB|nr:alpha/beta fold hydrolase [Lutimaribacter sp. EGI FJ00013]MCM2562091.1 alpha/beta hydrolase [Lutimaribacter sp. EGI FJ00013]MCO0613244.1 alpha/beta hydrolase [Lutimaribacter sp. EGI FJ00015]MCO0636221.1 alpha/beta hydrolase [Lutimaribacter sp. EGI FJ00014]